MQSQKFKIHVSPTYAIVKFKMKMEAHLKCIHQIIKDIFTITLISFSLSCNSYYCFSAMVNEHQHWLVVERAKSRLAINAYY